MAVLAFLLTIKLVRIGLLLYSVMGLQSEEAVVNMECALGPSVISEAVSLFVLYPWLLYGASALQSPGSLCVLRYSSLGVGVLFEVLEDTYHQMGLH